MKHLFLSVALMFGAISTQAQFTSPLYVPPTVSGGNISLMLQNGTKSFYSGFNTSTIGYNGSHLGPTLVLQSGQNVTIDVMNMLGDTTTTHWHGLHVSPANDGGPHNLIMDGATWSPSFTVMDKASTYWYHPHLHGKTMKQVVKGAAGMIIVQDAQEAALSLPRTYGIDDFPLVFQFLTVDATTKQIVMDDELDNEIFVNGKIQPYLEVPAQVVRLRLLNASSHRFFMFGFDDNRNFQQIGSDAGLLNAPLTMNRLMLGSGERAEILVDFSGQEGSSFYIKQFGTQLPAGYPGGPPDMMGMMQLGPLDNTNFNLLKINVVAQTPNPITTIPPALVNNTPWSQVGASTRTIAITASPMMSMTNFLMNGVKYNENTINFTTQKDNVEIWNITNQSMMPHPFHIHGNSFYVLSVDGASPPVNLQGRKDVVTVPPMNGSVSLIIKYEDFADPTMPYMYHCHILSHEDNGMMGQFIINNSTTGIETIEASNNITVSPNPTFEEFTVQLNDHNQMDELTIYNSIGRVVYSTTSNEKTANLSLKGMTAGNYYVKIKSNQQYFSTKILKIN
ncbi:MAG: multicopper oxidase domain-containing protein [Sphingobacteriales bacterium]|nr:multicopper oxidase domain-containing protein [Sphingobacteriales bacterium]